MKDIINSCLICLCFQYVCIFLRCQRSCENYAGYCKLYSRVKDCSFLELNAFPSIKVSDGDLGLNQYGNVECDVFFNSTSLILV